jgi:hypothetical protein
MPSDCQHGSFVEGFSSNDLNDQWLQPAFPASLCALDLMIPNMLRQDIKRKAWAPLQSHDDDHHHHPQADIAKDTF